MTPPTPHPPTAPGPARARLASAFVAAMLLPQAFLLFYPIEDFPLTCMPMYSGYAGPARPRYRFRFVGDVEGEGAREVPVGSRELGLDESRFMRHFFLHVYRSADPATPDGRYDADDPAAFEARLSRFFAAVTARYRERHAGDAGLKAVRLLVEREHPSRETREVGAYDVRAGRFTRRPGDAP